MKLIKITKAEVIPVDREKTKDYIEYGPQNETSDTMFRFKVKTKANNRGESKAILFEDIVLYAKNNADIQSFKGLIQIGNIIELDGYCENKKAKDGKYYSNTIATKIIKILDKADDSNQQSSNEDNLNYQASNDDDLPF